MWRVIVVLLAMLVAERVADACCLGCACTKYKDRDRPEIYVVQDIPPGYTRSVKGTLPAWSIERITKFLTVGTWKPHPTVLPKGASRPTNVRVVPAPVLRFITAEQAGEEVSKTSGQPVLIRRIEKHGRAILVEVDDRTYKLAACPKQPGFVCLLPPGTLALRPIPLPGDNFAEPPP